MPFVLDTERISEFVDQLPRSVLERAPKTHFPIQLPLAFPSPLHHVNLLTVLHLVHATLSQPRHTLYLAETRSDAYDIAIRGVFGLYLGSDETWGAQNLLSAKAWKQGAMSEAKVGEFFSLDIMREKNHPTLPVKIGERWGPGAEIAGDLVALFMRLGEGMAMRCVGEAVLAALGTSREGENDGEGDRWTAASSRAFCDQVVAFEPVMADGYASSPGDTHLPSAPLRLLQDLAALLPLLPELDLSSPNLDPVSNLSPLPLSPPLLLYLGLITPDADNDSDSAKLQSAIPTGQSVFELLASLTSETTADGPDKKDPRNATVSAETYAKLYAASVEACQQIGDCASLASQEGVEAGSKRGMSYLEAERVCAYLATVMEGKGLGVRVVVSEGIDL